MKINKFLYLIHIHLSANFILKNLISLLKAVTKIFGSRELDLIYDRQ